MSLNHFVRHAERLSENFKSMLKKIIEFRRVTHIMSLLIPWALLNMLQCKNIVSSRFYLNAYIFITLGYLFLCIFLYRDKLCIWLASKNSSQRLQRGDGGEAQQDSETQQGADHSFIFMFAINKIMQVALCWPCNQKGSLLLSGWLDSFSLGLLSWPWACTSLRWQWTGRVPTEKVTLMLQSNQVWKLFSSCHGSWFSFFLHLFSVEYLWFTFFFFLNNMIL